MLNQVLNKIQMIQEKFVYHFFDKKVEQKQKRYERDNNRVMEEDEIKEYHFFLFKLYSFILVVPSIFLIVVLFM